MTNDTDRVHELTATDKIALGKSGCWAHLDDEGLIHVYNPDGQQLYAFSQAQMAFEKEPLMLTVNLWFMAFNNGRQSMQRELKSKASELVKLLF